MNNKLYKFIPANTDLGMMEDKRKQREKMEKDLEAFLLAGGVIKRLEIEKNRPHDGDFQRY